MSEIPRHVRVHSGTMVLECQRCGRNYTPKLPLEIKVLIGLMEDFGKLHRNCKRMAIATGESMSLEMVIFIVVDGGVDVAGHIEWHCPFCGARGCTEKEVTDFFSVKCDQAIRHAANIQNEHPVFLVRHPNQDS